MRIKKMAALLIIYLIYCAHAEAKVDSIPVFTSWSDIEETIRPENDEQIVVLNFWATWCKPCVAELPYFNKLSKKYSDDPNLKVVLVSLDLPSQLESRLIPFVTERKLHPEVLLLDDPDANSWIDKVDSSWSGAIPATLFYRGSESRFYEQSFHKVEELEQIIQTLK